MRLSRPILSGILPASRSKVWWIRVADTKFNKNGLYSFSWTVSTTARLQLMIQFHAATLHVDADGPCGQSTPGRCYEEPFPSGKFLKNFSSDFPAPLDVFTMPPPRPFATP